MYIKYKAEVLGVEAFLRIRAMQAGLARAAAGAITPRIENASARAALNPVETEQAP
jgi:hypothetical protein